MFRTPEPTVSVSIDPSVVNVFEPSTRRLMVLARVPFSVVGAVTGATTLRFHEPLTSRVTTLDVALLKSINPCAVTGLTARVIASAPAAPTTADQLWFRVLEVPETRYLPADIREMGMVRSYEVINA